MTKGAKSSKSGSSRRDAPPSYETVVDGYKNDARVMAKVIERARTSDDRIIIAVVASDEYATQLKERLATPWWKNVISSNKDMTIDRPVKVTTPPNLQGLIGRIEKHPTHEELLILAHETVPDIAFEITTPEITTLRIFQHRRNVPAASPTTSSSSSSAPTSPVPTHNPLPLLIDGASLFGNTRIDEWVEQPDRRIFLAEAGVRIRVDPNKSRAWSLPAFSLRGAASDRGRVDELRHALADQGLSTDDPGWWKRWGGLAALTLGLASGAGAGALKCHPKEGGIYFRVDGRQLMTSIAMQAARVAAGVGSITAASPVGPAILLGAAGAAAIAYFIPWSAFFTWLGGFLGWVFRAVQGLWDWFASWWAQFKEWVEKMFEVVLAMKPAAPAKPLKHKSKSAASRK